MKKIYYLLFVATLFLNTTQAQEKIDLENIFNTRYTDVGIPVGDQVVVYSYRKMKWVPADTMKAPAHYAAVDGNIRRVLFLLDDKIIVNENYNCADLCNKDTLLFDAKFEKVAAKNWLRNIASTEAEYGYLKNEKNVAVYKDGEEWFISDRLNPQLYKENQTVPLLTAKMPFDKVYLYNHSFYLMTVGKKKVRFYKYESSIPEVNAQAVSPEKLNFDLPAEVMSVFVYDDMKLGWVYKDRVAFFEFDKDSGRWQPSQTTAPLYFQAENNR